MDKSIPVDTTDGELETGPAGSGFGLDLGLSSFTTSRHDYFLLVVLSVRVVFKLNFINIRLWVNVVSLYNFIFLSASVKSQSLLYLGDVMLGQVHGLLQSSALHFSPEI